MKKLITVIFLFIVCFPLFAFAQNPEPSCYETTEVEHLFTHCLIAYPEIAFKKDNPMRSAYNTDCITKNEFIKILESLHKNNYALIDIHETFKIENGVAIKTKFKVPKGKKALVMSFDDVNYDSKKMHYGMVDKICLDTNGAIATSTLIQNKNVISYSNEFIPMLNNFVELHPDFSIRGAKATINLTGYDGILGYRVSSPDIQKRSDEISAVKPIIKKLIAQGWNFACHSYGHYHMKKISTSQFENEITLWNTHISPLIGKTSVYVYPYGEWEVFNQTGLSEKHKMLVKNGFGLFCGVGMKTFYSYLPNKFGEKVLFMDRKVIDGTTLRANHKELQKFFEPTQVYDYKYRPS